MNNMLFTLAAGDPISALFGGKDSSTTMIIFMVAFIAFFYFVVVRPQNKKKKDAENMLKSMKPGDKVITIGGAHGKIVSIKDDTITIRVDDKAEITFEKSAISRVVDPNAKPKNNDKKKDDKKEEKKEVFENLTDNKS